VKALYESLENVTVVPRRAVVELQGRFQLYAVDASGTVVVKNVKLGPVNGNDRVVLEGLDGGESIIVEGIQKVRPGMTVDAQPLIDKSEVTALEI